MRFAVGMTNEQRHVSIALQDSGKGSGIKVFVAHDRGDGREEIIVMADFVDRAFYSRIHVIDQYRYYPIMWYHDEAQL